jgi:glycerophosphoryl diester phosphodiesterase
VAHRGANDQAPENTAAAFRLAMVQGIDGIEFDVQLSFDHVVVLHHDRTLQRIAGVRRYVSDMTYDELSRLDVGTCCSPQYKGERILRFDELLVEFSGKIKLFVEIKSRPRDRRRGIPNLLTEKVIQLIHQHVPEKLLSSVHILSFDTSVIDAAFSLSPSLRYILNHGDTSSGTIDLSKNTDKLWGHGFRIAMLTAPLAQQVHSQHQRIVTWTCNGPRQLAKAHRLNADIILTDRVRWLTEVVHGTR